MSNQKYLDFLGIGAQKSGTSWLYHNLKQIPEFNLPPIKEIHYFDRSRDYPSTNILAETLLLSRIKQRNFLLSSLKTVLKYAANRNWELFGFYTKWFFFNYSDRWYLSLFKEFEGYTGEITPSYSILKREDIRRIHHLQPDVRLILMLRNPIERAWSHYRFNTRRVKNFNAPKINSADIITFMESEDQSLRSDFIRTIDNYSSIFSKEQILICFYDAIAENPKTLMNNILKHICGDVPISTSHLNLKTVVNKSRIMNCPKEIEDYLKNRYYSQIKELSDRYGGYFTKWYEDSYLENSPSRNKIPLPTMYIKS